jgi:hypothetical protein
MDPSNEPHSPNPTSNSFPWHRGKTKEKRMTHQIAQEIISYCSNCNRNLSHTITAAENGRVLRVVCGTCKEEHPFTKPIETGPHSKRRSGKKAQPKTAQQVSDDWKAEMDRVGALSATVYTMGGNYSEGEKLDHHAFGMGMVQKLISPDKMEVLFESGNKMLIRGISPSD